MSDRRLREKLRWDLGAMPFLCRVRLHKWEHIGYVFIVQRFYRCERCRNYRWEMFPMPMDLGDSLLSHGKNAP